MEKKSFSMPQRSADTALFFNNSDTLPLLRFSRRRFTDRKRISNIKKGADIMSKYPTIIKIRRGINGFKYSACDENGYFIGNFNDEVFLIYL